MTAAEVHALSNQAVLAGWLLLVVAPRWRWTLRVVVVLVVLLAATYMALFASQAGRIDGGYGSLAGVARLLDNPYLLAAAWVHFLAFDLCIGTWMTRDAHDVGIHHAIVVPCLVLTFLAGPAGLLLYLAVRFVRSRVVPAGGLHA